MDKKIPANVKIYDNADAKIDIVVPKLRDAHILHISCHGILEERILDSYFELYTDDTDKDNIKTDKLTMSHILAHIPEAPKFAILAACYSGGSMNKWNHKSITLSQVFIINGFLGVLATLWDVMDQICPIVTEILYQEIFSDRKVLGRRALHKALMKLVRQSKTNVNIHLLRIATFLWQGK